MSILYKTNMENIQDLFSKYFILSRGYEVRDCEDLGSYPKFSIVILFQNIQLIVFIVR